MCVDVLQTMCNINNNELSMSLKRFYKHINIPNILVKIAIN